LGAAKRTGGEGTKRRPRLGQNFLADRRAAERIVDALGDLAQATVLEIGPGRGALTTPLAERARRLIAVEVDRVLAAPLRMAFAGQRNVEILEADILAVDLESLFRPPPGAVATTVQSPDHEVLAVGNLPYYITSDILLRLFAYERLFRRVVLMVQREVAGRIVARPGTREYGLLSATAQLYARVEKLFTLPPGAFFPPPKVHSTVLRLEMAPQFERLGVPREEFTAFLRQSFAHKRKTLLNNLKLRYDEAAVRAALTQAGARADVRAEALPLAKAAAVFRFLSGK
jgi:16S rRNA (adenine1518-N6/adenine1519-N6)-dimethyltransferase